MIGLSGTHGTGKTTLAREFAQKQDIPVVLTSASGVYKSLGMDPAADYSVDLRLGVQEAILTAFEAQYADATRRTPLFISDRTPLDLASYMLADIQRATVLDRPEVAQMVVDYVQRCLEATNRWFSTILLVQPGIALQPGRDGKAGACQAFMEHQNVLLRGLLGDERLQIKGYIIPRRFTELEQRVQCVGNAFSAAYRHQTDAVQAFVASGGALH